ncbi:hypothetical protein BD626DRAFT_100674 [Schizophyllum amplum]|uniref:Uncharacterized protein n=1 Tax=Schizophyllum amplum TaxID=97359 RepID=A0A550CRL0_9AGAR|nr:hypothetical protein BD626DRAFT_100674 [Auriculariopsis ampla]
MAEYVYALHDFLPENEDEIDFKAGERIEIVERDELYGDGWWKGRNLAGKVGLFPQTYTAPAPAASASFDDAQPTPTKATAQSMDGDTPASPALSSTEPPAIQLNGLDAASDAESTDGVMKETMTDVQKALEQLGARRDGDGRSFSFTSTQDDRDTETDTDYDISDVDTQDGENWHKGARRKLAEKARRAVEEAEKLELMMGSYRDGERLVAPPIDVEMSDESEDEHDEHDDRFDHDRDYTSHSYQRDHPYIPEESEEDEEPVRKAEAADAVSPMSDDLQLPAHDEDEPATATAPRTRIGVRSRSPSRSPPPAIPPTAENADASPQVLSTPMLPATEITPTPSASVLPFPERKAASPALSNGLPSPASSSFGTAHSRQPSQPLQLSAAPSKHSSFASRPSSPPQPPHTASSLQPTLVDEKPDKVKGHPSEWTVDDVIDWLRSKGFGDDVCEKFIEQEITGDVLLELDVNLLKSEIGIMAFGKRMRIANAITDLRRPPSVVYSDHIEPSTPISPAQQHSRSQSQSHSHHSFPGTGAASFVSNLGPAGGSLVSPTLNDGQPSPRMRTFAERDGSERSASVDDGAIGMALSPETFTRGFGLSLSPSDGALNAKAVSDIQEEAEEDRGVLSESEAHPANSSSVRRRIWGRSQDSGNSAEKASRHSAGAASPSPSSPSQEHKEEKEEKKSKDKDTARGHRARKSMDGNTGRGSERLSIFGGSLPLGRSRKPPPKYNPEDSSEKPGSSFTLGRMSGRKTSNGRPSTSGGLTEKEHQKEKDKKPAKEKKEGKEKAKDAKEKAEADKRDPPQSPTLLRKRTSSTPHMPTLQDNGKDKERATGPLKQGQSILEQIGEPDHAGWMRKKGDRYNSWKPRYFVLKGPHLYYLRSNSTSETKIKGYVNILGYKVTVDESVDPGRYGFRIDHDHDKTHYFSSEEKTVIRDWMKAIMKATIGRDYTRPVVSSVNIPTIPLMVAQAMNPAPRPPSPTAREATQKAMRRENPNQLSSRDARVLMGLPSSTDTKEERARLESFFTNETVEPDAIQPTDTPKLPPPRPSREMRRLSSQQPSVPLDDALIDWANSHLPANLQIQDGGSPLIGGLGLLRLAESIKGQPSNPPVPDSAFPRDAGDDRLDGLFRLFDFLLDNDVKMGSVSINDVRQGKRDKVIQIMRALKAWEDKRKAIAQSIGKGAVQAGQFMAPAYT